MEKYIITFEDGIHYISKNITDADKIALSDGILTIIRCSDGKELMPDGEWVDLDEWEQTGE